ncbi:hypothetical protein OH76DRAFT_1481370 [Lentinus brumalis]|uniref:UvrD-like helicase ATP-binding domain-containing protein n=1 Tax=Lentinus brumalis TaxID=2498619 RepID=A0A371DFW0_9APHY|nr:hypothetical protein OH76DRAFT_1481370 [Polyporus brumalis]
MSSPLSPISPIDTKARSKGRVVGEAILSLFDPTSLYNEAAVETAVSTLDRHLVDPSVRFVDVYAAIESVPYLVEFVLCAASEHAFRFLSDDILQPTTMDLGELPSSLIPTLSAQFCKHLPDGAPHVLAARRDDGNILTSILECLAALQAEGSLADEDVDASSGRWAARARQKKHDRFVRVGRSANVSMKPITVYGKEVPTSKLQAGILAAEIIEKQIDILKEYLGAFRTPEVAALYKMAYLPHLVYEQCDPQDFSTESQPATSGLGPWRILFSSRAARDLRKVRKDDKRRCKIVMRKIKDLSDGYFTPDNYKMLSGGDIDIPIYEAKMTGDSRLVYYIDCIYDHDSKVDRQVIKLFGIYTHAQIDQRFWDSASRHLRTISRDPTYRKRCISRKPFAKGDCVYIPDTFSVPLQAPESKTVAPSVDTKITKEQQEELHELLVLQKFVTFSKEVLKTILEDQDMTTVFDLTWLSHREREIMDHTSSCFVLGRGGTGKTTTIVYKMLSLERSWVDRFQATMRKPRQLFVTQSRDLVQKVEEYYVQRSEPLLASRSPETSHNLTDRTNEESLLVDADEEFLLNAAIPKRYGALKDDDFPMFLTYDHLCRLLEAEFRHLLEEGKTTRTQAELLQDILRVRKTPQPARRKVYVEDAPAAFVDYDMFLEKYWARFPESLKDPSLSPELVFGEILGVIKGSERARSTEQGYLDEDAYCGIRRRSNATSMPQRTAIYRIFQVYSAQKREKGQYDAADRTRMLIRCLDVLQLPRNSLPKFIYVDEAQDNLLIDALVLRKLCSNQQGMFWAGDTAQTISAGSAFRFQELRAFMYSESEKEAQGDSRKCVQAEMFHLTTNYRSHAGIVDCAHSLVELLTKYWPDSVDHLPPEQGQVAGSKPVWYSSNSTDVRNALFKDSDGGGSIEFGHQQCILVRNAAARDRLRSEMNSSIGIILTIYESKGLEFNDVLLYDFFEDSTVSAQWHILHEVSRHKDLDFAAGELAGICMELKHLYVAVTRARMNLWILDSFGAGEHLKRLWESKGLIEVHRPGEPIEKLAKSSSNEERARAARNLLRRRQYSEAMHGFERAGLQHEQRVALAYLLRNQARATPVNPQVGISQAAAFVKAAKAFKTAAQEAEDDREQRTYYRIAAECYTRGGDDRRAGAAYRAAKEYTLATQHFRKAGCFDEAVEVVRSHRDEVLPAVREHILDVSKLQYVRENHIEKAKELFDHDHEALAEYMDDYASAADCAKFHEDEGNVAKAAEYHINERQWVEAVKLLSSDRQNRQSTLEAARCILEGLWEHCSLCTPQANWNDPTITDLLGFAEVLDRRGIPLAYRNELSMFKAIFYDDVAELERLGGLFTRYEQLAPLVLCLDQVYFRPYELQSSGLTEITTCFRTFLDLARTLQRLSCDPDPCNNREIQRILAFKASTDSSHEMFMVFGPSHLYTRCNATTTPGMQQTGRHLLIPRWELERLVKETLRERLKGHVHEQKEAAHDLGRRLEPCIIFASRRDCPKRDCKQLHVSEGDAISTYNALVRIRVIQIMIYHTLYATDIPFEVLHDQQRVWLRRLYEALYPSHINLGSLHAFSPDSVPEFRQARSILKVWVRDFLNRIHPAHDTPRAVFFVNFMRATGLAMLFDRRAAADNLHRIPCSVRFKWQRELTYQISDHPSPYYVVHDLIKMLRCDGTDALDRGVYLLRHVVESHVHMDINVLCDFMDHLTAAIDIDSMASKNVDWDKYIQIAERLLHAISSGTGADYLLFERTDLSASNINYTRYVYLERVCKNLFLWSFNLGSIQAKQHVMRIFTTVRTQSLSVNTHLRGMTARYMDARDWDALALNMSRTMAGYKLDRLVQFHHVSLPPPTANMFGTRRTRYSRTDEITSLLGGKHIHMLPESSDRDSEVHSRVQDVSTQPQASLPRQPRNVKRITSPAGEDDDASEAPPAEFTVNEESAVEKIQAAYRKYIRRKTAGKDTLTEIRRRHLAQFRDTSKEIQWSDHLYETLFRRAIPFLVLALERLYDHLSADKIKMKTRLSKVRHNDLEVVQADLDAISYALSISSVVLTR